MHYNQNKTKVLREVTPEWDRLMKLAEKIKFGKIEIVIKDGTPTDAEHIVPHIKLNSSEPEFNDALRTIAI